MRFVLLDQTLELEPIRRALARTVFAPGDELFEDHFPGFSIVPGERDFLVRDS